MEHLDVVGHRIESEDHLESRIVDVNRVHDRGDEHQEGQDAAQSVHGVATVDADRAEEEGDTEREGCLQHEGYGDEQQRDGIHRNAHHRHSGDEYDIRDDEREKGVQHHGEDEDLPRKVHLRYHALVAHDAVHPADGALEEECEREHSE